MITQQKYLYLDGIFAEDEIRTQLLAEVSQFSNIDVKYRQLIAEVVRLGSNVYHVCMSENRLRDLKQLNGELDELQKLLKNFLYAKRQKCTRLYFISDDDLLEILGMGTSPLAIQEKLPNMFDRLAALLLNTDQQEITGLETIDGEVLHFRETVSVDGHRPLEDWMGEIIEEMCSSMRFCIKRAIFQYSKDNERVVEDTTTTQRRAAWVREFSTNVILASISIWWTLEVEEVFLRMRSGNSRAMKEFLTTQNHELDETLKMVKNSQSLNHIDRMKWRILAVADIQRRDYVESLVRNGVSSASDFEWDRLLRVYWMKDFDSVVVVQFSNRFLFGYEFIGAHRKLIVTGMTERVWLTITHALAMNMNCCIIGPAVGKTETLKELARTLTMFCVVLNCHENIHYSVINGTIAGTLQSGTWCCFDDLHKVNRKILSSMTTSVQQIKSGLLAKNSHAMVSNMIKLH